LDWAYHKESFLLFVGHFASSCILTSADIRNIASDPLAAVIAGILLCTKGRLRLQAAFGA